MTSGKMMRLSDEEIALIKSVVRRIIIGHDHWDGTFEKSSIGHDAAARLYCRLCKPLRIARLSRKTAKEVS